jgi:hypothetical protein
MDKKLCNDMTDAVANQLHYFDNYQNIESMKSAADVREVVEGGRHRYMHDAMFHAKVDSMVHRIIEVVRNIENA